MCSTSVSLALCRVLFSSPTQGERRPVVGGLKLVPGQGVGVADVGVHGDVGRLPLDPGLDEGILQIFNVVTGSIWPSPDQD